MTRSALMILMAITAQGCVTPPMRMVDYHCGRSPSVVKAPLSQMYTLYAAPHQRIESTTLSKSEPVGFMRSGGMLVAVAGSERIPLAEGNYVWLVEFGPQPPEDTGLRVAGTAAAVAGYTALGWAAGRVHGGSAVFNDWIQSSHH